MITFWLSFVDPEGEEGKKFLGVAVVDVEEEELDQVRGEAFLQGKEEKAVQIVAAVRKAREKGCNPGGEVMGRILKRPFPEEYKNRLLQLEELEEARLI